MTGELLAFKVGTHKPGRQAHHACSKAFGPVVGKLLIIAKTSRFVALAKKFGKYSRPTNHWARNC